MAPADRQAADKGDGGPRMSMVDIHSHYMPPAMLSRLEGEGKAARAPELGMHGGPGLPPVADLDARADWIRRRDIGRQLLSPEMRFARYDLPPAEGRDWSRRYNEAMRDTSQRYGVYEVVAMVPMQDGDAAARELEYAVQSLGCRGAMVHSQAPLGLHDPRMDPFWAAASELQVPVLVHSGMPCQDPRLDALKLSATVARPHEVAVAACQLMFGGVLKRFPALHTVLLMAGGTLPWLLPRIDQSAALSKSGFKPSDYIGRFHFDTLAYGPRELRLLLDLAGADRLMIGTDWPIELHESDPRRLLREQGLNEYEWRSILAETALRLFKLEPEARRA